MFWLIDYLQGVIGNFGVAILATTVAAEASVLPAAEQVLRFDEQDEEACAGDGEDQAALPDDRWPAAAGDHGDVQERGGQPAGRLLADPDPDPGVLCALQGDLRHHRNASRAVRRLSEGPVGADPTSLFNLFGLLPFDVPPS
jgi:hypothetical protein